MDCDKIPPSKYKSLKPGDFVKYSIDHAMRSGGFVKLNQWPKYLVLMNYSQRPPKTWSVQYAASKLEIFVKPKEKFDEEREVKKILWEAYKDGKIKVNRSK